MNKPESRKSEKVERDENMDKTLADSFPASDPPSTIPNPEDQSKDQNTEGQNADRRKKEKDKVA